MALKGREKILIVLAGIVILYLIFDYSFFKPQGKKIGELKTELKELDMRSAEYRQMAQSIDQEKEKVLRQEEELKRLGDRTLKGNEFRAFLRHLARESDSSQIKVISLVPQEEKMSPVEGKKEGPYKRVIVQVGLQSTYNKLCSYLKDIDDLKFLIHVDSLRVEKSKEVQPPLSVVLVLSMYIQSKQES